MGNAGIKWVVAPLCGSCVAMFALDHIQSKYPLYYLVYLIGEEHAGVEIPRHYCTICRFSFNSVGAADEFPLAFQECYVSDLFQTERNGVISNACVSMKIGAYKI